MSASFRFLMCMPLQSSDSRTVSLHNTFDLNVFVSSVAKKSKALVDRYQYSGWRYLNMNKESIQTVDAPQRKMINTVKIT